MATEVSLEVERLVESGYTYIEAALEWCKSKGLDPEHVGEVIRKDPNLKAKLEIEAESLRMLKNKRARLPL